MLFENRPPIDPEMLQPFRENLYRRLEFPGHNLMDPDTKKLPDRSSVRERTIMKALLLISLTFLMHRQDNSTFGMQITWRGMRSTLTRIWDFAPCSGSYLPADRKQIKSH